MQCDLLSFSERESGKFTKKKFSSNTLYVRVFWSKKPFLLFKGGVISRVKREDQTIFRHLPPLANKDEGMGKVSDEGLGWDFANPILKGQEGVSGMNPNLLWATQRDTSLTKTFFMQYFHKFFNSSHDIPSNRDCDVFKRSNPWYMDIEIILETAYIYWPEKGSGALSFP